MNNMLYHIVSIGISKYKNYYNKTILLPLYQKIHIFIAML